MGMRYLAAAAIAAGLVVAGGSADAAGRKAKLTGEVIDSFCAISGIMHGYGTAHHQCAVWCAVGGIPIGLLAEDGKAYIILKLEGDEANVTPVSLLNIQTHKITVEGEVHVRDGVNYLLVSRIVASEGIVNLSHKEHGIVPFGE